MGWAAMGAAWIAVALPAAAGPALLFDPADGVVLYAEDADDAWHPASLTKVMTAYLVFDAVKSGRLTLETKLKMSELGRNQGPSKIGLPVGAEMTVELALQALIIKSANDVAVMLAEGIDGTQDAFVEHMNVTAKRLGMTRTTFINPNGLPAEAQTTTARDLAKLTRAVLRDFPQYVPMWGLEEMQVGKRHIKQHNQLFKVYAGTDGLKTGFTCDSGYNVIATATRDGHKLAAIVLGEPSGAARSLRAANLLEHGFQYRAWDGVLKPVTLDTLEVAPDSSMTAISVRNFVPGPACGGHVPRSPELQRIRKQRLAKAQQKADAAARSTEVKTVKPATAAAVAPVAANPSSAVAAPVAKPVN